MTEFVPKPQSCLSCESLQLFGIPLGSRQPVWALACLKGAALSLWYTVLLHAASCRGWQNLGGGATLPSWPGSGQALLLLLFLQGTPPLRTAGGPASLKETPGGLGTWLGGLVAVAWPCSRGPSWPGWPWKAVSLPYDSGHSTHAFSIRKTFPAYSLPVIEKTEGF